ncbi:MAG: type III polyketide synthase [Chloroflexota bacterium]|nr:type III polyketide synthase [Chloroflexota bacterium]
MNAHIMALQTGVPERCFTQDEITEFYVGLLTQAGSRRQRAIRAAMPLAGVGSRYSAVAPDFFEGNKTTQERNDRYMLEAMPLGERVIRAGLEQADVSADSIDHFVVVSCTGFNVPGLDLLLAQRLGMSSRLNRTQVFGMGCYGAFPGIKRAIDSVRGRPGQTALVLTLELCTLHLQFDDSVESVVSTSLFADGAGMMLIGADDAAGAAVSPTLLDSETYCDFHTLDHMTFNVTDHGFRMYLSSYVPDVLAANVGAFIGRLLERHELTRDAVAFWAIHPGSKRIVEHIQKQLALSDEQVRPSLETLHEYGNMSSATVLFVLDRIIQSSAPQPGDYGVMMAFGPGLTMEALLVRW